MVTNGSGVLSFAAVGASAGQVIQVVTATDSTQRSTSSTSYVTASNTLSVTITPSSSANKILILASTALYCPGDNEMYETIFRGATNLTGASGFALTRNGDVNSMCNMGINYLDSPATTSATTYQVYFKTEGATGMINRSGVTGSITCMEIKG